LASAAVRVSKFLPRLSTNSAAMPVASGYPDRQAMAISWPITVRCRNNGVVGIGIEEGRPQTAAGKTISFNEDRNRR
jgi:hypothetical protein